MSFDECRRCSEKSKELRDRFALEVIPKNTDVSSARRFSFLQGLKMLCSLRVGEFFISYAVTGVVEMLFHLQQ